jgi:hypothetical protein
MRYIRHHINTEGSVTLWNASTEVSRSDALQRRVLLLLHRCPEEEFQVVRQRRRFPPSAVRFSLLLCSVNCFAIVCPLFNSLISGFERDWFACLHNGDTYTASVLAHCVSVCIFTNFLALFCSVLFYILRCHKLCKAINSL